MSNGVKYTLQYDINEQDLACASIMYALFANGCKLDNFEQSGC